MARHSGVTATVDPHEIVIGRRRIAVVSTSALDLESARAAISLTSATAALTLSKRNTMATLDVDGELQPGAHELVVGELSSPTGKPIGSPMRIPFFVSDSKASIPSRLRVESMTRLVVGELGVSRVSSAARPAGAFIELMKAVDRRSGKPVQLAFDQRGRRVDAERVFDTLRRRRQREFGKLHPHLKAAATRATERTMIPVAIWLRSPESTLPAKAERRPTRKPPKVAPQQTQLQAELATRIADDVRACGGRDVQAHGSAPILFAELTRSGLRELEKHADIAGLFLYDRRAETDLSNSMQIAQSTTVHSSLSITGKGVNVAVYEDGPDNTSNLSITARFTTSPNTSQHARHTHGIIKNIEANRPHGHAPDCNLHSANSPDLAAITWAAQTRGCTVISQSFHRDAEQTSGDLSFDDMFKDWTVLHWPYPTIVQAAGNGASSEFVNHKGFNSLTVANHDDTAAALAGDSVFRNPHSSHGDRELPEISANGTSVTCVGLTLSGTSMAAPAVAGCTALMQQASPTLESWPEGCRAILLASASKNITGSTWWADRVASVDGKDGAGALDGLEGVRIARTRRSRNAAGTSRGWDVGTLRSADIGVNRETTFSYSVTVPRRVFNPRVKVALAWDSLATVITLPFFQIGIDQLLHDLDIKIYDASGALVGYSGSFDNSYEVAEFAARAGETYTIKIRRWAGSADVWYGIAWSVQGLSIIRPDWGTTVLETRRARRR